jgi:hypothetical protein
MTVRINQPLPPCPVCEQTPHGFAVTFAPHDEAAARIVEHLATHPEVAVVDLTPCGHRLSGQVARDLYRQILASQETSAANPLDNVFGQLATGFNKAMARGALIMQAQFAIAAAVEGNDAGLRAQLGRLASEQRAEIRQAAKLVAKTIKTMPDAAADAPGAS